MWSYLSADLWQHWSCLSPQSISLQWNLRWFSSSHVFISRSLFHVSKNYFLNKVAAGNNPTFYSERFFIELFQVNKISPSPSYISYMHNNEYIISLGWMHSQTGCFDNVRLGLDTLDKVQNWLDKEPLCLNVLSDPWDVQCLRHISTFTLKY